jgi:Icc protein
MKLAWMTDLHLERVDSSAKRAFYEVLKMKEFDVALITGDISESRTLALHLSELAEACGHRRIFFVLGNHDFFGSSFADVNRMMAACCRRYSNLQHLGQGEIVRLGPNSALVGHRGWADGRAYGGRRTARRFPDQDGIQDLRYCSTYPAFRKMEQLGRESGAYFRRVLPHALTSFRHVFVATHVPPFARAVRFDGRPCEAARLPHFVNASAGGVIKKIGAYFPQTRMTVLCGHTHHAATVTVAENIEVRAGHAKKGTPTIQCTFETS